MNEHELKQPRHKKTTPPYQSSVILRNANKPPVHILAISLFSIFTYIGSYIVDIILLELYYQKSEWIWFGATLTLIFLSSIVIQLFSLKWFYDDGDLKISTVVMHLLFLGPVERYWNVFVYGLNTPRLPEQTSFQKKYLTNWRDVSMLRFFYPCIEAGPQITLQLYILLHCTMSVNGSTASNELYAAILVKILVSIVSFPIGLLSFNDDLKSCHGKGLTTSGYICQIIYRLMMLASRIIAIALFASHFKATVLYVLVVHCVVMIYWVNTDNPTFFAKQNGKCINGCFHAFFKIITGFVYVFSYISTNFTENKCNIVSQIIYYGLLFMENMSMMIAWIMLNNRVYDFFEITSSCVVLLTMMLGIFFMTIYYKVFHPNIQKSNTVDSL